MNSKCYGLLQVMGYYSMGYHRLWVITGYGLLQVMGYYRFNPLCVIRADGLKMLWVITGYGLSQYGLSQV